MAEPLEEELQRRIGELSPSKRQKVLKYVRALQSREGVPGKQLLRFAGAIPKDALARMALSIEEGCERIDEDAW
jgi:hypothetical protein